MRRTAFPAALAALAAAAPLHGQFIGSQELGDAVYHNLTGTYSLAGYDHAAIYAGFRGGDWTDLNNHRVIEVGGLYDTVRENSFAGFCTGDDIYYYGAVTNPAITPAQRAAIMATAEDFRDNSNLTYTIWGQIDWKGDSWDGTIADLENLRCDGMVECCYEMNGVEAWGREGTHYLITEYPAEHNDMPDFVNADESDGMTEDPRWEVSPKAQRGGLGEQYTRFRLSLAYPPVVTAQLSGAAGEDGWYRSAVTVSLSAADASGVYQEDGKDYIRYGSSSSGPWQAYGSPFSVSDTSDVYAFAVDRAGNAAWREARSPR